MSLLHSYSTAEFVQLLMITITSDDVLETEVNGRLCQTNHNFFTSSGTPIILECQQRLFLFSLA